ncbi:MAG TPA: PASTA domain-containing protein [Ignavibacteria bacterium]|nr:PASTA domain-containing protein [Ignavibacteria bacterium]
MKYNLNLLKRNMMPNLKNYSLRNAIFILNKLRVKIKVNGTGKVVSQSIPVGTKIHKNSLVTLNCKETQISGTIVY